MNDTMLSIVIPIYQEQNQVYANIRAIQQILVESGISHEFILVDDGSRDRTWNEIMRLSQDLGNVNALRLSRNFGKEAALCAGLDNIRGDACVIMDADLQHPPRLIPEMVRLWKESGYDVIEGVKASRGKENLINKFGANAFYSILKKLSGLDLDKASDFKLLDRKVVDAWQQMGERIVFFRGMSAWVGFKRMSLPFVVEERTEGRSKWSLFRLFNLAINAITAYSSAPLQIVTFVGVIFSISALILAIQTLYMKFSNIAFSGFTTVILLLLIIGSTLMISLGVIGTYIARIFDEVKGRPRYLVSEKIDKKDVRGKDS
jgi:dolichol-phosphate mannosyltransferase